MKKPRIDWLNHSLEFIVVIIGILIAFQLNQCSTDSQNNKTINTHLDQIKEETAFNKNSLSRSIKHSESNISKLDSTLLLISEQKDFDKINYFSLDLLNIGGAYIRKNAYQSLIESGDIRFMKNFKEKQKIIDLYEYYKWVESYDEIAIKLFHSDFYPYLKSNFDFHNANVQDKEVYLSKTFVNALSVYKRTSENKVQKYKDCIKEVENYLNKK